MNPVTVKFTNIFLVEHNKNFIAVRDIHHISIAVRSTLDAVWLTTGALHGLASVCKQRCRTHYAYDSVANRPGHAGPVHWLELNRSAVLHSTINIKHVYDFHAIQYAYSLYDLPQPGMKILLQQQLPAQTINVNTRNSINNFISHMYKW